MTSSSLLGIDSTRCRRYSQSSIFWHHSFRISRFSSYRLVQGASLSCLFIQDQTFSIGLRSGLFPGHLMRVMLGLFSSLEMTLGRPEPSFLSAMGASEFFLAWSKILRRLLSGILSCALICFRGTEAFQSSTAALLTSLVGGIFKTGETRKIGLAYILRNGEFSCGRTVKISSRSNQGPQQYPQKIWGSYLKGFRSSALPKTGQFFLRRLY